MKNLLLAFAFIGFITTSSFATKTIVKSNTTEVCGDHKKCDKKDCKHNTKECANYKKKCKEGNKKACCAKKGEAKKSCCAKGKAKTCDKSKAATKEEK